MTKELPATHIGHAPPPEGVLVGASVPRENEQTEHDEARVQKVMNQMKAHGESYRGMTESELRERAIRLLEKYGGAKDG